VQTGFGTFTADAGQTDRISAYRLGAIGGAGVVDGHLFLSRRLSDSFGLAEVKDFANAGIYVNNQMVGRTDAEGFAVLPRLLPYQPNVVSVDANALPLDMQIGATELNAIPYLRSGILVRLPIQRVTGALIVLSLDDGAPMPVGARVRIVGSEVEFPVAQRGEVYVTGLARHNRLQALWDKQQCEFDLELPKGAGPVPRIGPIRCKGVNR
jgi:outer membrane usher protein